MTGFYSRPEEFTVQRPLLKRRPVQLLFAKTRELRIRNTPQNLALPRITKQLGVNRLSCTVCKMRFSEPLCYGCSPSCGMRGVTRVPTAPCQPTMGSQGSSSIPVPSKNPEGQSLALVGQQSNGPAGPQRGITSTSSRPLFSVFMLNWVFRKEMKATILPYGGFVVFTFLYPLLERPFSHQSYVLLQIAGIEVLFTSEVWFQL